MPCFDTLDQLCFSYQIYTLQAVYSLGVLWYLLGAPYCVLLTFCVLIVLDAELKCTVCNDQAELPEDEIW